jgi:hypothetical protein
MESEQTEKTFQITKNILVLRACVSIDSRDHVIIITVL